MRISWEAVSAISSMLGTVLIVIAAWIALSQLKESAAARRLQGIIGFIEHLQSGEVRGARRFLWRHRAEIGKILEGEDWTKELNAFLRTNGGAEDGPTSMTEVRNNLATLEFVAVLSLHGNIPIPLERAYLAPMITGYWPVIEPIVQAIRRGSGDGIYLQHLESLVKLAADGSLYDKRVATHKKREVHRLIEQGRIGVARRVTRASTNMEKSNSVSSAEIT
jgi:hypothetical protein